MQNYLLIGVIIETLVLLLLTVFKKWTKKIFYAIAIITIGFCIGAIILGTKNGADSRENDQRKYSYMAARLVEDGHMSEAMEPMAVVDDSKAEELNVKELRGLIYNVNEMYETAVLYLEKNEGENIEKIILASKAKSTLEEDAKGLIVEKTKEAIDASEDEAKRWDAELKLLYLDEKADEDFEFDDKLAEVKAAVKDKDYRKAYSIMTEDGKGTSIEDDIIISQMYVNNYNSRTMADYDEEYNILWEEVAKAQADMNEKALLVNVSDEKEVAPADKEAYERASAGYYIALDKLRKEAIKRAINYMLFASEDMEDDNIAFNLQMSYLYYINNEEDKSKEYLESIFALEDMPNEGWMNFDTYFFRETYLNYLSDSTNLEYRQVFNQMMGNLYQGIFGASVADSEYMKFVTDYLDSLLNGFSIQYVKCEEFPNITAQVSCMDSEFDITKENVQIFDTDVEITDFNVSKVEVGQMNICYVLDKSGSMSGDGIRDAKDAIRQNIMSMEDANNVGLVSFDHEASIDCYLTNSVFMTVSQLDSINADGGTCITAGLKKSLEVLKNGAGKKVAILLSDGYDSNNADLEQVLQEYKMNDIVVYAIGLKGCDEQYLEHIADVTGGMFIPATESGQLTKIYQSIQKSLVKVYQITYKVESTDEERYMRIKMTDSLKQARREYTTVKPQEQTFVYENEKQQSDFYKQNGGSKGEY